jgi:hypothetical protein
MLKILQRALEEKMTEHLGIIKEFKHRGQQREQQKRAHRKNSPA